MFTPVKELQQKFDHVTDARLHKYSINQYATNSSVLLGFICTSACTANQLNCNSEFRI